MDREATRRLAKEAAIASLKSLAGACAGEEQTQAMIAVMIEQIHRDIDVKPPKPAQGLVVIGDAVGAIGMAQGCPISRTSAAADASDAPVAAVNATCAGAGAGAHGIGTASADETGEPSHKRARRVPTVTDERRLDDYPPFKCEVLLRRIDPTRNEYCLVVGHNAQGQLEVAVPGEPNFTISLHSLHSGLGKETRPLKRMLPGAAHAPSAPAAAAPGPSAAGPSATGSAHRLAPASAPPLQPREEELHSSSEQLEASTLRRSQGRTRTQLNEHREKLGLGYFGQSVVSTLGGAVSHLTFTFGLGEWNDLPRNETVPFEWWLGEGAGRLKAANKINPALVEQPEGGVPLFFAKERKGKGGALCCYGGHFTTASFEMLSDAQRILFKGKPRQARIKLVRHHFDETLAAAVEAIPVAPEP